MRSFYSIIFKDADILAIKDSCTGKSITNDVENVVDELYDSDLLWPERHLIYCDTDGYWDEILHDGKFLDFKPIRTKDMNEALNKIWSEL